MASKWAIQTFSPISRSYPKFPLTAICSNYIDDEHKVSFQNNNFCYINVNYDPKFHVFIFIPLFVSKIFAILSSYIQSLNDSRPFAHCPKFQHHSINHFTDSDLRLTRPSRPSERCLMNSNLLSLNHFLSRSFFPLTIFFTCTFRVAAAVDYAINIGARSTLFKTNLRRGCWKAVPCALAFST